MVRVTGRGFSTIALIGGATGADTASGVSAATLLRVAEGAAAMAITATTPSTAVWPEWAKKVFRRVRSA